MTKKQIYLISAIYKSKSIINIPGDGKSDAEKEALAANTQASKKVTEILNTLKLVSAHAYSWPDGSLYRYVEFSGSAEELYNLLS